MDAIIRRTSFAIIAVLLWGCSSHESQKIPANIKDLRNLSVYDPGKLAIDSLQFKKEETYGKIYTTMMPTFPGRIAFVDQRGRVFIGDQYHYTVHVYNADGSKITDIGRRGRGPGEFEQLSQVRMSRHYLYVYDFVLKRISVFSLKYLNILHTIRLQNYGDIIPALKGTNLAKFFVQNDTTILCGFLSPPQKQKSRPPYVYYLLNWNGDPVSPELLEQKAPVGTEIKIKFKGRVGYIYSPFGRYSLISESINGDIYKAWTNQFLIKEYDPNGRYQRAFYVRFKNRPLTPKDLAETARERKWSARVLEAARNANLPGTWPALHSMLIDDTGRLWVATVVKDSVNYKWWVLDKTGKPVYTFRWPKNEPIEYIRNGSMYVKTMDDQGTIRIVQYRIAMN